VVLCKKQKDHRSQAKGGIDKEKFGVAIGTGENN
jgi:hypothetical protein